jgi:23S rRNA (guanosine2251-2'-O)-methyltransferase
MVIYGRNPVREAIRGPRTVRRIWATKNALREPWLRGLTAPVQPADAAEIEQRAGTAEHQGICAEVSEFVYADPDALLRESAASPRQSSATPPQTTTPLQTTASPREKPTLLVALDQVQDPQNLGAICRTAECAGATGVVIPERRAAEVTAAVCKASAGAVEHLPVARVRNLADFLADAKRAGLWCYGADAGAPLRYDELDYADPAVLVLGSEGRGLRPRVAGACDALVRIPLRGRIESLSVSAAAAVLLYAAAQGQA